MASQFLVDGGLFVEVVDNNDGGGFSPKRVEELSRANKEGRFEDIAFPFEPANGYNGVRQLYSRRRPQENIFRTAWGSSLNFEFIYDRSGRSMIPRWLGGKLGTPPTPSRLTRLHDSSVQLTTSIRHTSATLWALCKGFQRPAQYQNLCLFSLIHRRFRFRLRRCCRPQGAWQGEQTQNFRRLSPPSIHRTHPQPVAAWLRSGHDAVSGETGLPGRARKIGNPRRTRAR